MKLLTAFLILAHFWWNIVSLCDTGSLPRNSINSLCDTGSLLMNSIDSLCDSASLPMNSIDCIWILAHFWWTLLTSFVILAHIWWTVLTAFVILAHFWWTLLTSFVILAHIWWTVLTAFVILAHFWGTLLTAFSFSRKQMPDIVTQLQALAYFEHPNASFKGNRISENYIIIVSLCFKWSQIIVHSLCWFAVIFLEENITSMFLNNLSGK